MSVLTEANPTRRSDLQIKPFDDSGRCVVKDLSTGAFFQLGPEESFLLLHLDGVHTPEAIRAAYETQFAEELPVEDFYDFLEDAREQGFLKTDEFRSGFDTDSEAFNRESGPEAVAGDLLRALRNWPLPGVCAPEAVKRPAKNASKSTNNILFFRYTLFDPDRLFTWLAPRIWFVWTRKFMVFSALIALAAVSVVWLGRQDLAAQIPKTVAWQAIACTLVVSIIATMLHEFAHGLTCKRYGGEVHEIGVLVMYFMPCFFCNVSDAWLIRDKKQRLWITLAGGYCDLMVWALSVFVWRVTLPETWLNFAAWIVLSLCGVRVILNFNPLIKLDGYYLLTDLTGIANLYPHSRALLMARLRQFLWGGEAPAPGARRGFIFGYGLLSWLLSLLMVSLFLWGTAQFLVANVGYAALAWIGLLGFITARRMFQGIAMGEVKTMIVSRRKRTTTWALIVSAVTFIVFAVPIPDRIGGPFTIRPANRFEVRAPIAAFLREVHIDEGSKVSPGTPLALLDVPDLDSQTERKRAEIRESRAKLRLLEVGPRPEEIAEERLHVERAKNWRDLASRDLDRGIVSLRSELADLEQQIRQYQLESDRAADTYSRDKTLFARQALQLNELKESQKKWQVFESQLKQAQARKQAREAEGTLKAEAELARRKSELADVESKLYLLEVGTRPEEIESETAHLARLEEEFRYLEAQAKKLPLYSPFAGVVVTPRLKEKVGRYYKEGDLIFEVESLSTLEAEIVVLEQDALRLRPGQPIQLKARALPFHSFESTVERIASSTVRSPAPDTPPPSNANANAAAAPATLVVYCRLKGLNYGLETGMTGYARISNGQRPIGSIFYDRALRLLRTEFWW